MFELSPSFLGFPIGVSASMHILGTLMLNSFCITLGTYLKRTFASSQPAEIDDDTCNRDSVFRQVLAWRITQLLLYADTMEVVR